MHFVSISVHSEQLEVCLRVDLQNESTAETSLWKCGRSTNTKINGKDTKHVARKIRRKKATHEIQLTREYDIKLDLQKGAVMTPGFIWTG